MDSLTIFLPFYNDAGTVKKMIADAYQYGAKLTNDLEVISVNDGSSDHTHDELIKIQKKFPDLRIINHKKNKGYGGAITAGIKNSTKDWVFYTDGDGQYRLDALAKLWELKHQAEVVNGYKLERADSWLRRMVGDIYAGTLKKLFSLPIRDVDCDYRLIKGPLVRSLKLQSSSGAITLELVHSLHQAGARFVELGVHHHPRAYGKSTFFTPRRVAKALLDDLKLLIITLHKGTKPKSD